MEIEVQANAKINLALDVLGERPDGYHEVDTILQEIGLHDRLTIENGRGGFVLFCNDLQLKLDENNLIYKAWSALRHLVEDDSVIIELEKNIPIAAGLGGGSADAAAILRGLRQLWNLDLTDEDLETIARTIDSDTAFFIQGGTQRGRGRGADLEKLEAFSGHNLLVLNSGDTISSRYVYEHVRPNGKIPMDEIVDRMAQNSPKVFGLFQNQLETVSMQAIPILSTMRQDLLNTGAMCALMSGSGPSLFGIYEDQATAERAEEALRGKYPLVYRTRTI